MDFGIDPEISVEDLIERMKRVTFLVYDFKQFINAQVLAILKWRLDRVVGQVQVRADEVHVHGEDSSFRPASCTASVSTTGLVPRACQCSAAGSLTTPCCARVSVVTLFR